MVTYVAFNLIITNNGGSIDSSLNYCVFSTLIFICATSYGIRHAKIKYGETEISIGKNKESEEYDNEDWLAK